MFFNPIRENPATKYPSKSPKSNYISYFCSFNFKIEHVLLINSQICIRNYKKK